MRVFIIAVTLLGLVTICRSQQATSYQIDATYDAEAQMLDATVAIAISNTGTTPLGRIVVNLYADAIVDKRSYFVQQEVDAGNLALYFAKSKYTTAYQELEVMQGGSTLVVDRDFLIREVAKISLGQPIAPRAVDTVTFAYRLYIPEKHSTQGYEEDSTAYYDLWYPTVAMHNGSTYAIEAYDGRAPIIGPVETDIAITVPANHMALLAGSLVGEGETDNTTFRQVSTVVDKPIPMVVTQRSVATTTAQIEDKQVGIAYSAYRSVKTPTLTEVSSAAQAMLSWLGTYPYETILVVEQISETTPIYREGLITLLPQSSIEDLPLALASTYLDQLFVVDVSDNIKAGLGMLYRQRYNTNDSPSLAFANCNSCSFYKTLKNYYAATSPMALDVSPDLYRHNGDAIVNGTHRPLLFWTHVYSYTRASWDAAMIDARAIGQRLSIEDWLDLLEIRSGKSMDWTGGVMSAEPLDYQVQLGGDYVRVTNRSDVVAPMPITIERAGDDLVVWTDPVWTDTTFLVDGALAAVIDADDVTLDFAEHNNTSFNDNAPTVSLLRPSNESFNQVTLRPGYNLSDRWMLGIEFSSTDKLPTKWQYVVAPMWSFGARDLVGFADVRRNIKLGADRLDRLVLGLSGRHFHYDTERPSTFDDLVVNDRSEPITGAIHNGFYRLQPYASLYFEGGDRTKALHLSTTYIVEQDMIYSPIGDGVLQANRIDRRNRFLRATYQDDGYGRLTDTDFRIELEFGDYANAFRVQEQYLKVSADVIKSWSYDASGSQFSIRVWGGAMLDNTAANAEANALNYSGVLALSHQGFNDYTYDEYHVDRLSNAAFSTRQVNYRRGGGFTHPTGLPSNAQVGQSQRFAFSSNVVMDMPFGGNYFPLQATFDFGGYSRRLGINDRDLAFLYSAGLRLNYDNFVINIPLLYSDEFSRAYQGASFWRRISFSINYPLLDTWTTNYEKIKY